jgi:hypothetical protein
MKTVLIAALFASSLFAQDGVFSNSGGKVYIGISAGPSFPVGDYGDDNPNNQKSGYAKTGYNIELSGGIRILNLLEISIIGFRNDNGTELGNLISGLNQVNPGFDFKGTSDSWVIYGAMGGFGLSYPAGSNFFADFKILGGYLNATSPEILLTTSSSDTYAKIEGSSGSSLVYYFSGAIRRPLIARLHASFGFQYTSASTKFNDVKTITSINGDIEESTTTFSRAIDAWGLTIGLKYFLF